MFDRERLDALVAEGWLRSQRHPEADLWIFNYTEKTQYENHWTPETIACRGLILDADGNVAARPFGKFFNYGTEQAGALPAEAFVVSEKIDGSLGIVYYPEAGGLPHIATRGSFVSEQAREGTAMLRDYSLVHPNGVTPLFEIVYPSNRIVVDYGDRRDLVLLTAIDKETGLDTDRVEFSGPRAQRHDFTDVAALAALERPNAEGFVVTFESGHRVKVKFEEYVRLHKIVTGVNARMIWESLKNGDDLDALLEGVPDEIYDWINRTRDDLWTAFHEVLSKCETVFDLKPVGADRKTLAGYFLTSGANPAVLFRMLDGKPCEELIWKAIKPGPNVPTNVVVTEV